MRALMGHHLLGVASGMDVVRVIGRRAVAVVVAARGKPHGVAWRAVRVESRIGVQAMGEVDMRRRWREGGQARGKERRHGWRDGEGIKARKGAMQTDSYRYQPPLTHC